MSVTHLAPFLRFAAAALIATGCATVPQAELGLRSPLRLGNRLTADEISGVQVRSAYDAVQRLKPNFLLGMRGRSDLTKRAVYLDGTRLLRGVEDLRMIEASSVRQIVFLNAIDATTRYGTDHGAGALVVTTWPRVIEQ